MFNSALLLTKRVTPISLVVVPFVGVLELTVMLPAQVPAPSPAVLIFTVRVAGVVVPDNVAANQPEGHCPTTVLP